MSFTILVFYALLHIKRGVFDEYLPAFAIAFAGLLIAVGTFIKTKNIQRFLTILVFSAGAPIYYVLLKGGVNTFDYAWIVAFFSACYMILPLKRANLVASFYFSLVLLTLLLGEMKIINIPYPLSQAYPILLASLVLALIANSVMREFQEWVSEQVDLAVHDGLTGLYNRRVIEEILKRETEIFKRTGVPMCILLIDIDHFKKINDTYGHSVGDKVLKAVSQVLAKDLRVSDAVGRWGGEEFLVILPGTNIKDGLTVAQRLRSNVEKEVKKITGFPVTVSIGVACLEEGDDPKGLLDKADKALYLAKSKGRNRVEVFKSQSPDPHRRAQR